MPSAPQLDVNLVEVEDDPSPSSSPLCSGEVHGESLVRVEGSPSSHSTPVQVPEVMPSAWQQDVDLVKVKDDPLPCESPPRSGEAHGVSSVPLQDPPIEVFLPSEGETTPSLAYREVNLPLVPVEPPSSLEPRASLGSRPSHVRAWTSFFESYLQNF